MIFSVQRYLEDYFHKRGLVDDDQYAVKLANLFWNDRTGRTAAAFRERMRRVRTAFFRRNSALSRPEFEERLLQLLDNKFKKKLTSGNPTPTTFPGGTTRERAQLRGTRRSIGAILQLFARAVEARAVDIFWVSRRRGELRRQPERLAQALLAVFVTRTLQDRGIVQREVGSGVGYVDVQVILTRTPHLIELKILKGSGKLSGVAQLGTYMRHEGRPEGWLVVVDARPPGKKTALPKSLSLKEGTVQILTVDVNPEAPSRKRQGNSAA